MFGVFLCQNLASKPISKILAYDSEYFDTTHVIWSEVIQPKKPKLFLERDYFLLRESNPQLLYVLFFF